MKYKTTAKAVKEGYTKIIKCSYCAVQYMTRFLEPIAYTSGVYGWNADIYEVGNGVAIVTGYRPFGNITPDYEMLEEYEEEARRINANMGDYDKRRDETNIVLTNFVERCTK